jgi:hypothetical protein
MGLSLWQADSRRAVAHGYFQIGLPLPGNRRLNHISLTRSTKSDPRGCSGLIYSDRWQLPNQIMFIALRPGIVLSSGDTV